VEDSALLRLISAAEVGGDGEHAVGDIKRARRIAVLIGDHADLLALACEPQHCLHEIRSERAVDPGGSENGAVLVFGKHGLLTSQLGCPIDAGRPRLILLHVRRLLHPVEYIVRGQMNQRNAALARRDGDGAGAALVHRERHLRVALGFVDLGISSSRHDHVRSRRGCGRNDRVLIAGKVQLGPSEPDYLHSCRSALDH
jgi:hypothetical protein